MNKLKDMISYFMSIKEVRNRVLSIIYIIVFLIFSTWFIFGPRERLVYAAININNSRVKNKNIVITSNDTLKYNKEAYNFNVINKTNKKTNYEIILVNDYTKSILKKCKILSNNYLKFRIKSNDSYSVDRNVRINGIIYKSTLNPNESKKMSIKLWLDKEKEDNECYYPLLKIDDKIDK